MKIADIHTHIFPSKVAAKATETIGEFYNVESEMFCPASAENLLKYGKAAGVCRFAVCSSAINAHQVSAINIFIAQECNQHPELLGLATLFPTMKNYQEEIDRFLSLGLHGVKIHSDFQKIPIDEPKALPMYQELARRGIPVLFHMGDRRYDYASPFRLKNLTRQVPDLVVIAAHFGGYQVWDASYETPQGPNVWYDTSSSLAFLPYDQAMRMLDRFGPERFLYGSDFPMWDPSKELTRFMALDLDPETQEKILYGNFMNLFRLSDN